MPDTGAPLSLTLEPSGTKGWADAVNANFTAINTAVAALQDGGTTGPKGDKGDAGPVGMIFAGAWQSTTTYAVTDVVTFNGGSYFAIAPSTNVQPDVNPNTWVPIALAGSAGPQGETGPAGPPGSGSSLPTPVAIAQGGTAATTAAAALVSLGAAGRGINSDIHELAGISGVDLASGTLTINNGTTTSKLTAASLSISQILPSPSGGGLSIGGGGNPLLVAGVLQANAGVQVTDGVQSDWLTLSNDAQIVAAGQIGLGTTTTSTATAGGAGAPPATVDGYLRWNIGGSWKKIAYFAD